MGSSSDDDSQSSEGANRVDDSKKSKKRSSEEVSGSSDGEGSGDGSSSDSEGEPGNDSSKAGEDSAGSKDDPKGGKDANSGDGESNVTDSESSKSPKVAAADLSDEDSEGEDGGKGEDSGRSAENSNEPVNENDPQPTFIGILPDESPEDAVKRIGTELTKALRKIAELEAEQEVLEARKNKYKAMAKRFVKRVVSDSPADSPRHRRRDQPARSTSKGSNGLEELIANEYEQFVDEEELVTDDQTSALVIKHATPRQLVNRLAGAKPIDGAYVRDFVVVYAHFMETDSLLEVGPMLHVSDPFQSADFVCSPVAREQISVLAPRRCDARKS
jgi:hypothetical protein